MIDDTGERRRKDIARALRALAVADTRQVRDKAADEEETPLVSAFVTRRHESLAQLAMPVAALIVVIEGRKAIVDGADHRTYGPGEVFVLPAHSHVDVVNEPDAESGVYRALFVRFPRDLVIEAARLWPQFVGRAPRAGDPELSAELASAICHAAEALSRRVVASRRVVEHRILEILLVLAEQGVLPLVPKYVDGSVAEAVRLLIRHRLHLSWTAARVAADFGFSEASLRRRLRAEGESLQGLLRDERMKAAYTVLNDRDADVADALAATGYRSRSHFARHFHARFGASPSSVRARRS